MELTLPIHPGYKISSDQTCTFYGYKQTSIVLLKQLFKQTRKCYECRPRHVYHVGIYQHETTYNATKKTISNK